MCSPTDASLPPLRGDRARLGVDVDRYSFIVSDLHRLLIAGLPAHCESASGLTRLPAWPDDATHRSARPEKSSAKAREKQNRDAARLALSTRHDQERFAVVRSPCGEVEQRGCVVPIIGFLSHGVGSPLCENTILAVQRDSNRRVPGTISKSLKCAKCDGRDCDLEHSQAAL
jgi:hypothetical protein